MEEQLVEPLASRIIMVDGANESPAGFTVMHYTEDLEVSKAMDLISRCVSTCTGMNRADGIWKMHTIVCTEDSRHLLSWAAECPSLGRRRDKVLLPSKRLAAELVPRALIEPRKRGCPQSFASSEVKKIDMSGFSWKGAGHTYPRNRNAHPNCPTCKGLILENDVAEARTIRVDLFDLAESADGGECLWCALIYRGAIELGGVLPPPEVSSVARIYAHKGKPLLVDWPSPGNWERSDARIGMEIYRSFDHGSTLSRLGYAPEVAMDISSEPIFDQIRDWIHTCESSHVHCRRSPSEPPTRLVYFEKSGETWSIRLVQEVSTPVDYIALSHCWGKQQNLTTTTASLPERLKSISWNDLPSTYQHTMLVAQHLSIRYLWIDSLCIIQDDISDWEAESAEMDAIYENSYLTIAAMLAPGDAHGFLQSSDERSRYLGRNIDLTDFEIPFDLIKVRNIHDYRTVRSEQPHSTRAWTLQEILIPPRLLTFSVLISFECAQTNCCECGNDIYVDPFCGDAADFDQISRKAYAKTIEEAQDPRASYDYWFDSIVQPYSKRKLTKTRDRLPALTALAAKFALRLEDSYLAGLWKRTLFYGMAWHTKGLAMNMSDRAPSWSWASIEGQTVFFPYELALIKEPISCMDVLEATVDATPSGVVTSGFIRMRTIACRVTLFVIWSQEQYKGEKSFERRYSYLLFREGFEEETLVYGSGQETYLLQLMLDTSLSTISISEGTADHISIQRSDDPPDIYGNDVEGPAVLALLFTIPPAPPGLNTLNKGRVFLVLTPHATKSGIYRRIGLLISDHPILMEATETDVFTVE